jgi:CelD/BcsL family acetyltransferase involved in cellulose biosynthesis
LHDPDAIPEAFAWKRMQYPDNPDFSDDNLMLLSGMRDSLTVSTLRADGQLMAAWVGFIHAGVWSGWIFAHNPDRRLKKYCLGWQLLYSMVCEAFDQKCQQFDFSIGGEAYKWAFATHARVCGPLGRKPLHLRLAGGMMSVARAVMRRLDWRTRPGGTPV